MAAPESKTSGGPFDLEDAVVLVTDITGATAFFRDPVRRPLFNAALERWCFAAAGVARARRGMVSAFTGDGMILCWASGEYIPAAIETARECARLWRAERVALAERFPDADSLIFKAGIARGATETVRAPIYDGVTQTIQGDAVAPAKHACEALGGRADALVGADSIPAPDGAGPVDASRLTGKAAVAKPAWRLEV
ncbi:MAG: hypothetical protein KIS81_06895 [Maricaulaceae bacterium]|nr:hypothetical protein [Maricaulaceae bacterium]